MAVQWASKNVQHILLSILYPAVISYTLGWEETAKLMSSSSPLFFFFLSLSAHGLLLFKKNNTNSSNIQIIGLRNAAGNGKLAAALLEFPAVSAAKFTIGTIRVIAAINPQINRL